MDIVDNIIKRDNEKSFINNFCSSDNSFSEMDDIFEEIMNSDSIPKELDRRISSEESVNEKIEFLKMAVKHATQIELDFLNNNLDYIINEMMKNTKVQKYYNYQKELKRIK